MYFDENNNYFDIMSSEHEYMIDKYINKQKNNYTDINIDSINFNRNSNLYSPKEGLNKGNMFKNLYSKYKNHVYNLSVNGERDKALYNIQMHNFAMKDLNLYLDTHPNDTEILNEYQKLRKSLNEIKNDYEKKYGPLCSSDVTSTTKWTWISNPWPWDKGGK